MQPLVAYDAPYCNEKEESCQEESSLFTKSGQRQNARALDTAQRGYRGPFVRRFHRVRSCSAKNLVAQPVGKAGLSEAASP